MLDRAGPHGLARRAPNPKTLEREIDRDSFGNSNDKVQVSGVIVLAFGENYEKRERVDKIEENGEKSPRWKTDRFKFREALRIPWKAKFDVAENDASTYR